MALVVDAGGRVTANPKTGKINSAKKKDAAQSFDEVVQTASMPASTTQAKNELAPATPVFQPVFQPAPTPKKVTASQPIGLSASTGSENEATHDAFGLGLDRVDPSPIWEKEAAEREGREERTENYFGEQYEQGGGGWYPLMQNAHYGNTPQNDAYLRNAIENGLSEEDAYDISHYDPKTMGEFRPVGDGRVPTYDIMHYGLSPEEAGTVGTGFTSLSENESYGTSSYNGAPLYDPETLRRHGAGAETAIDDGTSYDYGHMTSEWMTGPQYRKYVEMGMGGRDVDDIDPTQVYSKVDEAREYGFVPYMPNETTYNKLAAGDVARIPGEIGTRVANLRTSLPLDYSITYGDDGTTISGEEFDRVAPTFLNNYYHDLQYDPDRIRGQGQPTSVLEFAVPNADGGTSYAHGRLVDSGYDDTLHLSFADGTEMDVPGEDVEAWEKDEDGNSIVPREYTDRHGSFETSYDDTFYLTFSDGQRIGVSPDYMRDHTDEDGMVDFDPIQSAVSIDQANGELPEDLATLGEDAIGYEPVLTMSDGTTIPLRDVERIYWDESAGDDPDQTDALGNVRTDDDIRYDFGPLDISKPRRLMDQEIFDFGEGSERPVNTDDLLNNVIDWTLGSAPISTGLYAPWVYSASQATNSLYGIEPGSYNPATGSRGLTTGGWDDEGNLRYGVQDAEGDIDEDLSESTRWWNSLGNAAIPLTEMLVGPVGEHIVPLEGVTSRIPFKTDTGKLIADTLVGYGAEGVEEDLGNVFEGLMQYGPSGAFANPVLDENGEPIKDIYGHEVRDAGTNVAQRVGNFFDPTDLSNAFVGGALVSPAMGLATTPINGQSFLRNIGPAAYRDYVRNLTGVDRYNETDLERDVREALEEGRIPDVPAPRRVSDRYASMFDTNTIGDR